MDKHHIQILYKFQPEHQLLQKQSSPHPQIYSYQVVSMVELKVTLHTQLQHNFENQESFFFIIEVDIENRKKNEVFYQ